MGIGIFGLVAWLGLGLLDGVAKGRGMGRVDLDERFGEVEVAGMMSDILYYLLYSETNRSIPEAEGFVV